MSDGVPARIAFAIISSLLLAFPLLRREPAGSAGRLSIILSRAGVALSLFWMSVWCVIAAIRFPYPYEMDWNCGAMRDHCARLLAGKPLFSPPTIEWMPYFYNPLYVQICALVMRVTGGSPTFQAMRAVSVTATALNAALIFAWMRRLTRRGAPSTADEQAQSGDSHDASPARAALCLAAVGIFFAAYRMTGAWLDIERVDSLLLFWTLLAGFLLDGVTRAPRSPLSAAQSASIGLVLALAFQTKQQALVTLAAAAGTLLLLRRWRDLTALLSTAGAFIALTVWANNRGTDNFYAWYCLQLPFRQGIKLSLAAKFLGKDMMLYAPCLTVVASGVALSLRRAHRTATRWTAESFGWRRQDAAFGAMALSGLFVSFSSRAHWGGYENVLIPGFLFTGMAACTAAARTSARLPGKTAALLALLLAQFVTLAYRPEKQIPTSAQRAAGDRYLAAVRTAEASGPTLAYDHGGFTRIPQFSVGSFVNFPQAGFPVPQAVKEGLVNGYYQTIFLDMQPEPGSEFADLLRFYRIDSCLEIEHSWVVTGYETPNPEKRVWVLHFVGEDGQRTEQTPGR